MAIARFLMAPYQRAPLFTIPSPTPLPCARRPPGLGQEHTAIDTLGREQPSCPSRGSHSFGAQHNDPVAVLVCPGLLQDSPGWGGVYATHGSGGEAPPMHG
jgi:hypothetical protein